MEHFAINEAAIRFQRYPKPSNAVFSLLIPSWNNVDCLKLLIESIQKNSVHSHQICVHLNEGQDGSIDFLEALNISYSHSPQNIGVCYSYNAAFGLAETDYVVLFNDDMYVAPRWDEYLLNEIQAQKTMYWAISGTMIEREDRRNPCVIAPYNYGETPQSFQEERFLKEFADLPHNDWSGSQWQPLVVHRYIWGLVGGLSVEFSPGMYSDPDFMMKLWQVGIREFKGVAASRVYHFMSKSTQRIKKNDGRTQFFRKWKVSSSTFLKHYLGLGQAYNGKRTTPTGSAFERSVLKDKLKGWFK